MKKKYIAPSIEIINMEPTSIMEVSGWTPSGDKKNDRRRVFRDMGGLKYDCQWLLSDADRV